jgi:hypothetical protein
MTTIRPDSEIAGNGTNAKSHPPGASVTQKINDLFVDHDIRLQATSSIRVGLPSCNNWRNDLGFLSVFFSIIAIHVCFCWKNNYTIPFRILFVAAILTDKTDALNFATCTSFRVSARNKDLLNDTFLHEFSNTDGKKTTVSFGWTFEPLVSSL